MSFGALVGQRDRGAQRRRGPRRVRPRHRRGRHQPVSPSRRRRPDLGDRLGLLRLPRRRRTVRRRGVRREGDDARRSRPSRSSCRRAPNQAWAGCCPARRSARRSPPPVVSRWGARWCRRLRTARSPRRWSSCEFIATLRRLSGGKPVGFKLCIGARTEFLSICKAILATGIAPDFVIVDGSEGGTGCGAAGVRGPRRDAADRGPDAGAQQPGRHRPAGPHPDRRVGQGGQRRRHRQPDLPGRRLHACRRGR